MRCVIKLLDLGLYNSRRQASDLQLLRMTDQTSSQLSYLPFDDCRNDRNAAIVDCRLVCACVKRQN